MEWRIDPKVKVNCRDCSAECCKHIAIPIDEPETWEDLARIKWYISHAGITVYKDTEGDWLVEFVTKCGQLDGHRCMAWGTSKYPRICSEYAMQTCVMNEEGEYWEVMFKTPHDVNMYAKEQNIAQTPVPPAEYPVCVTVPIDTPDEWRDFDDYRWYIAHRDVRVFQRGDRWYVHFNTLCNLRENVCPVRNNHLPVDADVMLASWEDVERYCAAIGIQEPQPKPSLKLTEA
jgi:hypothetical protein